MALDKLSWININPIPQTIQRIKASDEEYFNGQYKDYVSNSRLKLLNPQEGGSPQAFLEGFKSTKSQALTRGTAIHQLTLESDVYFASHIIKPGGKLGDVISNIKVLRKKGYSIEESIVISCKECDYYKERISDNLVRNIIEKGMKFYFHKQKENEIILASDNYKVVNTCVSALKGNPSAQRLLNPVDIFNDPIESHNEDVFVMQFGYSMPKDFSNPTDYRTGVISVKIKADNWSIDENTVTLNDLKTTGHPIQYFMNKSFINFHYYRQMAMYGYILKLYAKYQLKKEVDLKLNMIVVETLKTAHVKCFEVSKEYFRFGFDEFISLLKRAAYHKECGYDKVLEFEETC